MTLTVEQLKHFAMHLPDTSKPTGDRIRFAVDHPVRANFPEERIDASYYRPHDTVEFRARGVNVEGARCLGWYYHDLLVKVCV